MAIRCISCQRRKKKMALPRCGKHCRERQQLLQDRQVLDKSTLINLLAPDVQMETGAISEKIQRGKHTTRHSQLIMLDEETYIFDTPGFSSLASGFFRKRDTGNLIPGIY